VDGGAPADFIRDTGMAITTDIVAATTMVTVMGLPGDMPEDITGQQEMPIIMFTERGRVLV
jgi:hypothetical protein